MGAVMRARNWTYVAAVALLTSALAALAMPNIEAEPVKVTHHNSGPRYDIDIVGRTRLAGANQDQAQAPPAQPQTERPPASDETGGAPAPGDDVGPIGHVAIRRIFLFPIRPSDWSESESGARDAPARPAGSGQREQESEPAPSMFAKPLWPFMTPARPPMSAGAHQPTDEHERPRRPHLFGADEASRSPADRDQDKQASGLERDQSAPGAQQVPFDPIQMMLNLMHQAISNQVAGFQPSVGGSGDAPAANDNAPESSDERPLAPGGLELSRPARNETSEDVVELDGKKYLRKMVVNRHVGENIIFVTRRLVFVPLNETDAADSSTAPAEANEPAERAGQSAPSDPTSTTTASTTTTTTTTTTTAEPSSTAAAPASTSASPEPTTASSEAPASESANKAAERLQDPTAPAPAASETPTKAPEGSA